MNIALINQFYPPDRAPTGCLLQEVARTLQGRGHRVSVIASAGLYGEGGDADGSGSDDGVEVRRVGRTGRHGTGFIGKALDYARFYPKAYRQLCALSPAPDRVLCMTTPPFCASLARRYQRRTGTPYLLWTMDLYPEALAAAGWMSRRNPAYKLLARRARLEREGAACAIALGPDMARLLRENAPGARTDIIPVWSALSVTAKDEEAARQFRVARGWAADDVVLMYSGNMGRAHRAEEFAALADRLKDGARRVRVVLCGDGPSRAKWQRQWPESFEWMDPVASADVVPHLLSANVHLLSQEAAWTGVVVPSKYQAACALGRPVIFAGPRDSAVAEWITDGDTGWVVPAQDRDALERVCREVYDDGRTLEHKQAQARQQSTTRFDAVRLKNRVADWVERGTN